jgi:uncharacterized HAD superfamily protein
MKDFLLKELKGVFNIPRPAIGIDVDGTIDQAPEFFSVLSNNWPGDVHIITMRDNMTRLKNDLMTWGIKYHHIHLVQRFADKGEIIDKHSLVMFFDDMPEVLQYVNPTCNVCLVRNDGNFDADKSQFIMSKQTAYLL